MYQVDQNWPCALSREHNRRAMNGRPRRFCVVHIFLPYNGILSYNGNCSSVKAQSRISLMATVLYVVYRAYVAKCEKMHLAYCRRARADKKLLQKSQFLCTLQSDSNMNEKCVGLVLLSRRSLLLSIYLSICLSVCLSVC